MQRATVMLFTLITTGSAMVTSNVEQLRQPQHHQGSGQGLGVQGLGVGVRAKAVSGAATAYKFLGRAGQNTGGPVCGQGDFRDRYRSLQPLACAGQ